MSKPLPKPDTILREYAGRYLAWHPDGLRIVASGLTFEECEANARKAGHEQVAVGYVPEGRTVGQ